MKQEKLIYTPKENIPIGRVISDESDTVKVEFKKSGKSNKETLTVDELLQLVYRNK